MGRRRRRPHHPRRPRHAAPRPGQPGRPDVRWRAPPGRARRAARPRRPTCSSSTSPPTIWTWPASTGWPGTCVGRRGALVVVTHDRWFLDAVCTTTWEVADQTVRAYEGGFAAWTLARAERAAGRRRHRGPPAEPAAQGDRLAAPRAAGPHLQAPVPHRRRQRADRRRAAGPRHRVACSAWPPPGSASRSTTWRTSRCTPARRTILRDVTWQVGPGDRIAILGANGAGKTTLLRLLAGVTRARRRPPGHRLHRAARVPLPGAHRAARRTCGCWRRSRRSPAGSSSATGSCPPPSSPRCSASPTGGSGRRSATSPVASGGGCRCCGCSPPSPTCCCFDEPTNDLDTDTLAALEDLLDSWPGTMIVASHDRYLVERVTDTAYGMFGDGRLVHLPGGVDEYLARDRRAGRRRPGRRHPVGRAGRAQRERQVGRRGAPGPQGADPAGTAARQARPARGHAARSARRRRHRLRQGRRAGRPAQGSARRTGADRGDLADPRRGRCPRADRVGRAVAGPVCGVTPPHAGQSSATPHPTALETQTWRTPPSTTPRGRSTGRSAG